MSAAPMAAAPMAAAPMSAGTRPPETLAGRQQHRRRGSRGGFQSWIRRDARREMLVDSFPPFVAKEIGGDINTATSTRRSIATCDRDTGLHERQPDYTRTS